MVCWNVHHQQLFRDWADKSYTTWTQSFQSSLHNITQSENKLSQLENVQRRVNMRTNKFSEIQFAYHPLGMMSSCVSHQPFTNNTPRQW